jgi:hypothetical protein
MSTTLIISFLVQEALAGRVDPAEITPEERHLYIQDGTDYVIAEGLPQDDEDRLNIKEGAPLEASIPGDPFKGTYSYILNGGSYDFSVSIL